VVFCKKPAPFKGKQRLAKTIGVAQAYVFAQGFLNCALEDAMAWAGPVVLSPSSPDDMEWASGLLGRDHEVLPQPEGSLGFRLQAIDQQLRRQGYDKIIFMGSDLPALTARHFDEARTALDDADVVFSLASDGGVTLMGASVPWPDLTPLPWSTEHLGAALEKTCRDQDLRVTHIMPSYDIDVEKDLLQLQKDLAGDLRPARCALLGQITLFLTPEGDRRGYIESGRLREVWFHTGTACNLSCGFCLEGSKPGDTRLGLVKLPDVKPYIEEALTLGVEQFSFTGGEPFLAKDLPQILALASRHRPCLVLTNGTEALQRRIGELDILKKSPNPISFRVSLDHYEEKIHDLGRGVGNFLSALQGLKMLQERGFPISVARHIWPDEDRKATGEAFRALFKAHDLPENLTIVAFPDFAVPGSLPDVPFVTTDCMTRYQTEISRKDFMCHFSRMVVKQDGAMRVYACTLVDDDLDYDLGPSLTETMDRRISLKHHRCYSCFAYGASCSEI